MLNPGDRCAICGRTDDPDLTAEPDAAEAIVTDGATVKTEWGVRYGDLSETAAILGAGPDNERRARHEVACWPDTAALVRRTVTYGPWEEIPGDTPRPDRAQAPPTEATGTSQGG